MTHIKLILNNLRYYKRSHIGVLLGTMISTSVLVGALIIGDSVRFSLRELTLNHIGKTEIAILAGDRFFTDNLSDSLTSESLMTAPVLHSQGIAIASGGQARINSAQVYGVCNHFLDFANQESDIKELNPDEAILNSRIARRLGLKKGDTFLLRMNKASAISSSMPLAANDSDKIALHFKVVKILNAKEFGDFSMRISQTAPLNIFVSLDSIATALNVEGRANLILTTGTSELIETFRKNWTLDDAELKLKLLTESRELELTSERILLSKTESDAALSCGTNSRAIFTYFVNSISKSTNSTPYSFIAGLIPDKIANNEIIIGKWLANDIQATIGDQISLKYFVSGPLGQLNETNRYFKVHSIDAIADSKITKQLTPDFPGLSDADSCQDWDTSLPIDLDRIRDKDEAYWNKYGATPKAFITLQAAQSMWQNQFGNATAIRFSANGNNITNISEVLINKLDPVTIGFQFIPIREHALSAGEKSVDFGQLFIGLSFFLIAAALLLTGMLFVLAVEKRREEIATLLSLGYTPRLIKRLLMAEGCFPAIFGALTGTVGGIIYTKIVLYALGSIWRGAVGTSALQPFIIPSTLLTGFMIGLTTAILCMWISLSKHIKQGIAELYSNVILEKNAQSKSYVLNSIIIALCGLSAIAIMFIVPADTGMSSAGAFFGAGSLLLIAGISACKLLLQRLYHSASLKQLSMNSLSLRNISRQQKRSLTAIAILASGIFLVIAVAANKKDPTNANTTNSDGTGGFSLYGEFTVPLIADLNSPKVQKDFGLDVPNSYIQIHAKDGDDASCLNLNHISSPRIISIDPKTVDTRKSFTFTKLLDGLNTEHPWLSTLGGSAIRTNNIIPAVADMEVITWSLGKKIGDTISYTDDSGQNLKLKLVGGLANSIFQGSIIIAKDDFRKHFPTEIGTKILLIDSLSPISRADPEVLTSAFEDYGLELISAKERLAEFNTIQNTYLSIFLILGGLGIILGTVGLGIIVMRNIDDRRQELAIMRAVGYKQQELYQLLLREHIILLIAGVTCGSISGFLAVLPAIVSAGGSVPYLLLTVIIMTIIANGILWISVATTMAIRGNLFDALRRE